jgi:hypothetical protein
MSRTPALTGDLEKLPRWARSRIETAEHDAEYWKGIANSVTKGESDTFYIVAGSMDDKRILPPGISVQFKLDSNYDSIVEVKVREGDTPRASKKLEIYGHGGSPLKLLPRSSNMFYVEIGK